MLTTILPPVVNRVQNKGAIAIPDGLIEILPKGKFHSCVLIMVIDR
jgi:hypothetical protein